MHTMTLTESSLICPFFCLLLLLHCAFIAAVPVSKITITSTVPSSSPPLSLSTPFHPLAKTKTKSFQGNPHLKTLLGETIIRRSQQGIPINLSPWNRLLIRSEPADPGSYNALDIRSDNLSSSISRRSNTNSYDNDDNTTSTSTGIGKIPKKVYGGVPPVEFIRSHMALLILEYSDNEFGQCSGSIVSPTMILTAAHCFEPSDHDEIRNVFVFVANGTIEHAMYFVRTVATHAFFNPLTVENDIAIVQVHGLFPLTHHHTYISANTTWLEEGQLVYTAGFGMDSLGHVGTLNEIDLVYQLAETCISKTSAPAQTLAGRKFLCATAKDFPIVGGKDTCKGDSGGPLYINTQDPGSGDYILMQVGITSFGGSDHCGLPDSLTWYTNVEVYADNLREYVNLNYTSWQFVIDESSHLCTGEETGHDHIHTHS